MTANEYHFITHWQVQGTCGEVADVLGDPLALVWWWPAVYLGVRELAPADARGLGRRVAVHTKGWLPYTLRWHFEVVESRYPYGFTLVAAGDFDGRGIWTFRQNGAFVDITYDWQLRARKPLLRSLSWLMKPLFAANHRWAMSQGEESLRLELERRRATSDAARAAVPPPPGPVTYAGVVVLAGTIAAGALAAYVLRRAARRRSHRS